MQVGQLTGFLSYVLQIVNSLMLISNVFLMLTRSLASARRINQVFDECQIFLIPRILSPKFQTDGSTLNMYISSIKEECRI